jgi:hypothetical protein
VVARTRYQDDWVLNLYHAMQAAIGQQLKIEYEPPRELTPELTIILRSWTSQAAIESDEPSLEDRTEDIPRHP